MFLHVYWQITKRSKRYQTLWCISPTVILIWYIMMFLADLKIFCDSTPRPISFHNHNLCLEFERFGFFPCHQSFPDIIVFITILTYVELIPTSAASSLLYTAGTGFSTWDKEHDKTHEKERKPTILIWTNNDHNISSNQFDLPWH